MVLMEEQKKAWAHSIASSCDNHLCFAINLVIFLYPDLNLDEATVQGENEKSD